MQSIFYFFYATNPSFFFNVGLCLKKKKREHATYDIRDSYYKPVASAKPERVSGAGDGRSNKERQRLQPLASIGLHTNLLHWHPTVGINAPPENLLFLLFFVIFFVQSAFSIPRCRSHWLIQAIKSVIRV